jgi:hypothetical protein
LLVAAMLAATAATTPTLATDGTITVSGDSVASDCGAAKSPSMAIKLTGNLEGCLAIFTQHFNCRALNGFDFSTELGREEFDGKLDGKALKFDTLYTFDAIWPLGSCPTPAAEKEIAGSCIHHVSGDGVTGVIRFYDIIPTAGKGATNFFYEGTLTISDGGHAAIAPVVPPANLIAEAATAQPHADLRRPAWC